MKKNNIMMMLSMVAMLLPAHNAYASQAQKNIRIGIIGIIAGLSAIGALVARNTYLNIDKKLLEQHSYYMDGSIAAQAEAKSMRFKRIAKDGRNLAILGLCAVGLLLIPRRNLNKNILNS
jgi:hypothetical protein